MENALFPFYNNRPSESEHVLCSTWREASNSETSSTVGFQKSYTMTSRKSIIISLNNKDNAFVFERRQNEKHLRDRQT